MPKLFHKNESGIVHILLQVLFGFSLVGALSLTNSTLDVSPAVLLLPSTYESISVYAPFSADSNSNQNQAILEYRKLGDATWIKGMEMTLDKRDTIKDGSSTVANPFKNQWRASILGLIPNTSYEVKVTFSDPDGVDGPNPVLANVITRNDNIPLGSKTYYVSTSGSDISEDGSITKPLQTLNKAVSLANPGDTVLVRGGTYYGSSKVNISKSGRADAFIDIRAYSGEKVVLDGSKVPAGCGGNGSGFSCVMLITGSYVKVSGFEIRNGNIGIKVGSPAQFVIIEKNLLNYSNVTTGLGPLIIGDSFSTQNSVANITVQDNEIHPIPEEPNNAAPVYLEGTSGGHVIRNNKIIFDYPGSSGVHGTDCIGGGPNKKYFGSLHKDTDVYNNTCVGATDDGISLDGGSMNVRVWGNNIKSANIGISVAPVILGPAYIFRNTVSDLKIHWGSSCVMIKEGEGGDGTVYFYHNTFYGPNNSSCGGKLHGLSKSGSGLPSQNIVMKNNIIDVANRPYSTGGCQKLNFDLLFTPLKDQAFSYCTGSYSTFPQFVAATGQGINSVYGRATFENKDFNLSSTSLGVDQGEVILGFNNQGSAWPYLGNNPDMGATESGFSKPLPTSLTPTATLTPTPSPTATPAVNQPDALTFALIPTADAYVSQESSSRNFGTTSLLKIDGSPMELTYMKFDLSFFAGKNIKSAKLRIKITNSSAGIQNIKAVENSNWSESIITYANKPDLGNIITSIKGGEAGSWVEIDLTEAVLSKIGQLLTLALETTSPDGFEFKSRETSEKPSLIIAY